MSKFCLQIEVHELQDGTCHGISPSSLSGFALLQIRGGSKGVCPIGRRTPVREGEAGSEASVGRGKAERFLLQGHLSPRGEPLPLRAETPVPPIQLNSSCFIITGNHYYDEL
jgi:hypothetical protein